jgi:hypothetical protein
MIEMKKNLINQILITVEDLVNVGRLHGQKYLDELKEETFWIRDSCIDLPLISKDFLDIADEIYSSGKYVEAIEGYEIPCEFVSDFIKHQKEYKEIIKLHETTKKK